METDRELLEAAARAAGIEFAKPSPIPGDGRFWLAEGLGYRCWNPLTDDGDALRLAVKLRMNVRVEDYGASARIDGKPHGDWNGCEAHLHGGIEAATRRAIVRAAAEIGKAMPAPGAMEGVGHEL